MFGIDSMELLIIVIVAVVVIGPKDLPRALYKVGQVVGKARAMGRHFRTGIDAMVREAELEELQKQWDKENARIMAEHPVPEPVMPEKALVDGTQEAVSTELADAAPATDAFDPPGHDVMTPLPSPADEAAAVEQPKGAAAS